MTTTAPATSVKQSTVTIIREKKEHYNQLVVPIDNKREQVIGTLDELYPVFAMELPTKDLFNFENPDWDFGLSTSFIIKNVLN